MFIISKTCSNHVHTFAHKHADAHTYVLKSLIYLHAFFVTNFRLKSVAQAPLATSSKDMASSMEVFAASLLHFAADAKHNAAELFAVAI